MNPEKAIDAILDVEHQAAPASKHVVYPMSIGRYALLEKVKSPILTGDAGCGMEGLLTTLYIMTQPTDVLRMSYASSRLQVDALEWADDLSFAEMEQIVNDIRSQLERVAYMSPDSQEDSGKKKQTMAG